MAARFRTIYYVKWRLPRRWASPVYVTDVAMLVIQYAQICLPCLFAVAMVPVFCFCLPCVIRLLAALHDPQHGRGATRRDLSNCPHVLSQQISDLLKGEEPCCPCAFAITKKMIG